MVGMNRSQEKAVCRKYWCVRTGLWLWVLGCGVVFFF